MYDKILVPLDGSALAEDVLPHVAEMTSHTKSEVILLQVCLYDQPSEDECLFPAAIDREAEKCQMAAERMRYLNSVAQRLRKLGFNVRIAVEFGYPAERIVDYANEHKVSLIAMSTHGRSGISRWVYGSVADRVLQAATVPVLLIRSSAATQDPSH